MSFTTQALAVSGLGFAVAYIAASEPGVSSHELNLIANVVGGRPLPNS